MRIPLSWLGEFVTLPEGVTPEQVHADLVRVGFEEESIRRFESTGPIVVGEVLAREPEPQDNGKTINWCQVRVAAPGERAADGGDDVRGIVCGAHNFEVGDKVVVTLPGAVLPGDFVIAPRKTYGHISDGMIASARELALGDDHEGIIVLARLGLDPEVGADALKVLGMHDTAVEINVTPDRGYAFSVRGVAREYAHATGVPFRDPAGGPQPAAGSGFPLIIADDAPIRGRVGCTGFVARVVRGIDPTRPTPAWMVSRLTLAGMRSLSLEVDISNYVMLELGQPLHAYDLAKLQGGITVRRARSGESLVTLDGQTRALHPEDLLITDDSGPIGIAGVMGGESTKADDSTTDVLIEAATFDPVSIARSARRHKLPSEASRRFERGVDPLVARAAVARMVELLVTLGGGSPDPLGVDLVAPVAAAPIELPLTRVNGLLGTDYTDAEARGALELIGCQVVDGSAGSGAASSEGATIVVTPPSWRSDLTRPADLIEEVARIIGYDRIPSVLPVAPAGRGFTREQTLRRRAANTITAFGFDEVQCYPFVSRAALDLFGASNVDAGQPVHALRLANPLDGEAPFLRRSLLPGLVGAAQRNVSRGLGDLSLVEFGVVFDPEGVRLGTDEVPPLAELPSPEMLAALNDSIPAQSRRVAGLLLGDAVKKQPGEPTRAYDWADALDAARAVARSVSAELLVRQGTHRAFHPGRTAELCVVAAGEAQVVGVAGELLPEIVEASHLPGRVAAFELDLDLLLALAPREPDTHPLSSYPAATQDLTLLTPEGFAASDVLAAVVAGAGDLLEHASIVDDYRGTGVPEGQRALTFALRFRADDRTLKAEEATAAKLAGAAAAERAFGARPRD